MSYGKPEIKTIGIEQLLAHLGPAKAMIYGMGGGGKGGKGGF